MISQFNPGISFWNANMFRGGNHSVFSNKWATNWPCNRKEDGWVKFESYLEGQACGFLAPAELWNEL